MKWEEIKNRVGREVHTAIVEGRHWETNAIILQDLIGSNFEIHRGKSHREMVAAYADKAWDIIQAWDVRSVGRLRDLFPAAFPPSLRSGELVCYMEDGGDCDWVVERRQP